MKHYRITFVATVAPFSTLEQSIICEREDLHRRLADFFGYIDQELNLPDEQTLAADGMIADILDGDHIPGTSRPVAVNVWDRLDVVHPDHSPEWFWADEYVAGTLTWDIV